MLHKTGFGLSLALLAATLLCSCLRTSHEVKTQSEIAPIEIKPIHITIDINVKVDKALDDFFGDIDQSSNK
jgi:hypothetical protein